MTGLRTEHSKADEEHGALLLVPYPLSEYSMTRTELPRACRQRSSANDYAHRCFDWLPPSSNRGTTRGRLSDRQPVPLGPDRGALTSAHQLVKPKGFVVPGRAPISIPASACLPLGVMIASEGVADHEEKPVTYQATSQSVSLRPRAEFGLPSAANLSRSVRSLSVKATT